MAKHALLSASSAARWLNCTPSAHISAQFPDKTTEYTMEGTSAHALCEYRLLHAIRTIVDKDVDKSVHTTVNSVDNFISTLSFYNEEMEDCANGYVSYILELYEAAKKQCSDPVLLIEQRVDFSRYVPSGFGTADCILISDKTLNVVDYKHGKGVEVSAELNPQMMLYALGAIEVFDCIYDIDEVTMSIYQPRKSNVSAFTMTKDELLHWAETELAPKATLAYEGKGELQAGNWCKFCKAKATCKERARVNLELAKFDFVSPSLLSDEEITEILNRIDALTSWANDVSEYALEQAIKGKVWNGYKLVEGRSSRKYVNEELVADKVSQAGFDPYEHKVLGITAMQKMLGKTRFEELLGAFIEKPQGKPTLVPESDKRPAMHTAKNDFSGGF